MGFTGVAAGLGGESANAGRAASEQLKERIERLRASLAQRQTAVSEGELGVQQQYADIAKQREIALEKLREQGEPVGPPVYSEDGKQVTALIWKDGKLIKATTDVPYGPPTKEQQVIRAYKALLNTPGLPPGTADAFLSKAFGLPPTTWHESKPTIGPDGKPHIYYYDDRNPANRIDAGLAAKLPSVSVKLGATGQFTDKDVPDAAQNIASGDGTMKDVPLQFRTKVGDYMRNNKLSAPPKAASKLHPATVKNAQIGLNVLNIALFGNPARKQPGLIDTIGVLDDPSSRDKLSALMAAPNMKPGFWSAIGRMSHSRLQQSLTTSEERFMVQYRRAVSAINSLRAVTGLPRSTQQLMDQYMTELPNPVTSRNSADARYQLQSIQREIDAAKEAIANGEAPAPTVAGGADQLTPPPPKTSGPPLGATMKVPGSDGKLHWSDGKQDLGVVQ